MSNLTLVTGQWHENINQVEKVEPILGGSSGNANLATKQLAENILWLRQNMQAHKVGDVYTTTLDHANAAAVAAHHGYGTWKRFSEGRTLVGFSTNADDPSDYKTIGNEFGENTHTMTIGEAPSHKHSKGNLYNKFLARSSEVLALPDKDSYIGGSSTGLTPSSFDNDKAPYEHQVGQMSEKGWEESTEASIGNNEPHNNIQPSVVIGCWVRTA